MADMEFLRHQMRDVNEQLGVPVDEPRVRIDPMLTNEPKFMTDMVADMAELNRQIKEMKVQILAGDWLGVAAVEEPQPTKKKKKKKKECDECGSTGHVTTNCTAAYDMFEYDLDYPKARPQM